MKKMNLTTIITAYQKMETFRTQKAWAFTNDKSMLCYYQEKTDDAYREFKRASEELEKLIKAVEGKSTVRLITAEDICECVLKVENKLNITKKAMNGIVVVFNGNENLPSAYKYSASATTYTLEFKNNKWWLTDLRRDRITKTAKPNVEIRLTPEAEKEILTNHSFMRI